LNAAATAAMAGCGGTAVLVTATVPIAASSSCVADDRDASARATVWSSSSAVAARTVTNEPAFDLTVMLIGASVCMLLLDWCY